ncbi:MAG: pilus assembly protein TadG-related protein [Clostridiaceae bacterium]
MSKLIDIKKNENGSTVIIFVFIIFLMLGVGGFAVDASMLYAVKGEMRKAADSAALSGAQRLFSNSDINIVKADVKNTANDILTKNGQGDCLPADVPVQDNKVTVTLEKDVSTYFMKIFGVTTVNIKVTSVAAKEGEPLTEMTGVIPLGISEGTVLTVGTEYTLKDDNKIGSGGWFGYLDIGQGNSASKTLDYITNGSPNEIKVGDTIGEVPGNMTSITQKSQNKRAVIIIFNPTTLKVSGFALCDIRTDGKKTFYGKFIQTVKNSSVTGTINDSKIYKTRLVE